MVLGLTESQETLWTIANWAGLAVVVAVAVLLTILVLLVGGSITRWSRSRRP